MLVASEGREGSDEGLGTWRVGGQLPHEGGRDNTSLVNPWMAEEKANGPGWGGWMAQGGIPRGGAGGLEQKVAQEGRAGGPAAMLEMRKPKK